MKINILRFCDNRQIMKRIFFFTSLLLLELSSICLLSAEGTIERSRERGLTHIRHQKSKSRRLHRSSDDCVAVAQSLSIDSSVAIPAKKFHDAELQICNQHSNPHHATCCSRDTERHLHSIAVEEFRHIIRAHGALFKDLLASSIGQYREEFLHILDSARNRTKTMLLTTYKIPEAEVAELVDELFIDLTSYLRRQKIEIDESIDRFFNSLFPVVFLLTSNNGSHLTPEYRNCVANQRPSLQPFGIGPRRLAQDLTKSLGTARSLLDAFQLAADVMNATDYVTIGNSCALAVTRLSRCPVCEGHVDVRPCADFCYNVMRGCLVSLTQLNPHWNKFVESVEHISYSMKGSYDMQLVLQDFEVRLSDDIGHAIKSDSRYQSTVTSKCGELPAASRASVDAASSRPNKNTHHDSMPIRHGPEVRLSSKIEMFVKNVAESKNFYNKLPDALCSSERLSAGNYETCWNGTHLGPYTRDVTAQNFWSQIDLNPEVRVPAGSTVHLSDLTDRLDRTAKLLRSRVLPPHVMLADEVAGSGDYSGQGDWRPYPGGTDDEDSYPSGSGSGDGEQTPDYGSSPDRSHSTTTDLEIETPKAPSPYQPTKSPAIQRSTHRHGTSGAGRSTSVVIPSSITTLVILLCRLFLSQP